MPRPKRSKVTPSAPAALPAKLLATLRAAESSSSASQKSSNSDDSDGLVKRSRVGRNSGRHARNEVFMTGALPKEERNGSRHERPPSRATRTALTEITRNADFAKRKKERALKLKEGLDAQDREVEVLVPSSLSDADRTGMDQTRRPEPDTPKTAQKLISQTSTMPSANWRAQATPRMDSSILALGNFKRRSRQPSLLGIGRPDDSPSLSNFDLGEDMTFDEPELPEAPNALRSRQKAQTQSKDTVAAGDTPLSASRHDPTLSSSSRKRKRTPKILVRRSQSPTTSEADRIFGSDQEGPRSHPSIEDEERQEPELPALNRAVITEVLSDTMAPPQSSSPPRGNAMVEDLEPASAGPSLEKRKQQKPAQPQQTASNKATTRRTAKPKNKKPNPLEALSTATLQSLLPRRRTRHRGQGGEDEFEVPSSGHEPEMTVPQDDEDELSFMPVPKKKVAGKSKRNNSAAATKSTKSKTPSRATKPIPHAKSKPKPRPTTTRAIHISSSSALSSPPPSPSHSDSDAEPGPDTSIDSLPAKGQKELKSLARKFREVDQWEMVFEEITASSSSPRDGR
ncbi:hypothetical protein MMC10_004691 [Thelotrema lepadinum]|nr:hypothetical protein [Thelotrema lepadinum]